MASGSSALDHIEDGGDHGLLQFDAGETRLKPTPSSSVAARRRVCAVARQGDGATVPPVAWGQARSISDDMRMMVGGRGWGQVGRRRRRGLGLMVPVSRPGFCLWR